MSVQNKGGRGKRLPYESEMVRTPVPIKELVQQIVLGFRCYYDTSYYEQFLKALSEGVSKANAIGFDGVKDSSKLTSEESLKLRLLAIEETLETFRKQSKNTRDWVQANKLIDELSGK